MAQVHYWELALYNEGKLVGKWFDLDGKTEEEHDDERTEWLESVAKEYNSEDDPTVYGDEWILGDVEGVPSHMHGDFGLDSAFFGLEEFKRDNPYIDAEVIEAAMELQIPLDKIEDAYRGSWHSDEAMAEDHVDECWEVPEHLRNYLDMERIARDLMMDMYDFNTHYFWMSW